MTPVLQARSAETLARLLDAAEAALADGAALEDLTIRGVAEAAGCSTGAFYKRFEDKQALLSALLDRFVAEARATAAETLAPERLRGKTPRHVVAVFVRATMETYRRRGGMMRAFLRQATVDPTYRRRAVALFDGLAVALARAVHGREASDAAAEQDALFAVRVLVGVLDQFAVLGVARTEDAEALEERLVDSLEAIVTRRTRGARPRTSPEPRRRSPRRGDGGGKR